MTKNTNWHELPHADKVAILRDVPLEQIVKDYIREGLDQSEFRQQLGREAALWRAKLYEGNPKIIGRPPNKEVVLGAWRDLDRSEAILELIDNSIDAWNRRQERYPDKSAPELNIYIDVDSDTGQLTYEDNAGGVSTDNLENLVVPGFSETDALTHSIGSYKTGGKKAVFRLATAVNITTHYWNPAETGDEAVSVHLDEQWLSDTQKYEFPYYSLRDKRSIQRGQTRYVMQLRPEPKGNVWYSNPEELTKIERYIQNTYSLLIARYPAIRIYFPRRGKQIVSRLENLYDFTGTEDATVDIRPQLVRFKCKLEHQGISRPLEIEIVVGCRVTTGVGDGKAPGFDLYGNNRLFVTHDQRLFSELLPKGQAGDLIRGFVNILGPNVFVPWDTHKRHLNYDREVIELIRTHPSIKELIENWRDVLNQISRLKEGGVKKIIQTHFTPLVDPKTGDLGVPHKNDVEIDADRKRGQKLPGAVFVPKVVATKVKKDVGVTLTIPLPTDDARQLAAAFHIQGQIESRQTKSALIGKIKEHLMQLVRKGGKKK